MMPGAWASKRVYAALAVMQAADAVVCAIPIPPIKKVLDDVGLAEELRPVLPIVKAASAIGLLSVYRFPGLARLTTLMLTVYMVLAVSFHVKAKDWSPALAAATILLAFWATITVKGPAVTGGD
jgi:hypothetical protein